MNRNTKLALVGAALLALAGGVARAGGMISTAVCNQPHGLGGSWWGNTYSDSAKAQAEADAHNQNNPGHAAQVFTRPE